MMSTRARTNEHSRYAAVANCRYFATRVPIAISLLFALGCGDGGADSVRGAGGVAGAGGIVGAGGMDGRAGADGSGDELTIAPISDQVVIRNFLEPRSFEFEVAVPELDTVYSIAIASTDESVVSSSTSECNASPCAFTFTPASDRNATADIDITVTSGDLRGETSFSVTVQPRLVRDATDGNPPAPDSLRDVIAQAEDGDIIGFDTAGAFSTDTTIAMVQTLEFDSRLLRIEGPAEPRVAIQSGEVFRAVHLFDRSEVVFSNVDFVGVRPLEGGLIVTGTNTTLELKDSTLRDGLADFGGAILARGALRIESSTFFNNAARNGGAVFAAGDTTQIANTAFDSNGFDPIVEDTIGGGLVANGPTQLIDVTFIRNRAARGGGMLIGDESTVDMTGGKIGDRVDGMNGGNQATQGGGVFLTGMTALNLDSVGVELNRAERGGGFYIGAGTMFPGTALDVVESRISENFATQFGGGLFVDGGIVTMDSISGIGPENEAGIQDGGGGIYVTNGGNIDGVSPERVNGNRGGPAGAESDINRDPNDF